MGDGDQLRDRFLLSQHKDMSDEFIEMWFWTYHIRKNVNYQGEWSLQHILSPWLRFLRSQSWAAAKGELVHCLLHGLTALGFMLLSFLRAPRRSMWRQSCGGSFYFRN